jgi:hypothetical protein
MNKKLVGDELDFAENSKVKNVAPKKLNFVVSPLPLKNAPLNVLSSTLDKKRSPRSPRKTSHKEPRSARIESPKKKPDHPPTSHPHRHDDVQVSFQQQVQQQLIQELQQYQQSEVASPLQSPHSKQPLITTPPPAPISQQFTANINENSVQPRLTPVTFSDSTPPQKGALQPPSEISRKRSSSSPQNCLRIANNGRGGLGAFKLRPTSPEPTHNVLSKNTEINPPNLNNNSHLNQNNTFLRKPEDGESLEAHTPPSSRTKQISFLALKNHTLDDRELFYHFKNKEYEFSDTRDAVSPFRYIKTKFVSLSTSTTPRHSFSRSSTPPEFELRDDRTRNSLSESSGDGIVSKSENSLEKIPQDQHEQSNYTEWYTTMMEKLRKKKEAVSIDHVLATNHS